MRVGFGYDVHPLAEGRRLVLGGIEISHDRGLLGHSDADALSHAVADALLGAAALGDIGEHFPASDPQWKDADSLEILRQVMTQIRAVGLRPVNVDATIIAEEPMLLNHLPAMREKLAECLGLELGDVSVKATRAEGLGSLGRREGIAAHAVALVCGAD